MLDSEMCSLHLAPKKTTQLVSICGSQVRPCSSSEDLKTRPELALLEISFQQEIHGNTCFQYSRRNTVNTSGTWYLGVSLGVIEIV